MGSVKDLVVDSSPTEIELGLGKFLFSDRFSVFDWGEMPNHIPLKGASLALMGAMSFELLESSGFNTHYIGLIDGDVIKPLNKLSKPSNIMCIKLTNVYKPKFTEQGYDYSFFEDKQGVLDNYLIPLECVYRNGLPLGSSIFNKINQGKLTLKELGLAQMPKSGDMLSKPLYDFSTKLEESGDRMIKDRKELLQISGLTENQFFGLEDEIRRANDIITKHCERVGLINYDGKIELMKYQNKFYFVDVLGTPDECRFSLGNLQVSKEVIRQWYKKNDSVWASAVDSYKNKYNVDWRQEMINNGLEPASLPSDFLNLVSEMYAACANTYCKKKFFDVRPLNKVMNDLEKTDCAIHTS